MINQTKICTVPHCDYPAGQCSGACWSDDESRIDIIGQNGNDGLHYDQIDNVNNPPHYKQGDIECIDAIRAALTPEEFRGYCKGNILKYTWRERHKGGDESVKKAMWYGNRLLEEQK